MSKKMKSEREVEAWKEEVLKNLKRELARPDIADIFKRLRCVKAPKS